MGRPKKSVIANKGGKFGVQPELDEREGTLTLEEGDLAGLGKETAQSLWEWAKEAGNKILVEVGDKLVEATQKMIFSAIEENLGAGVSDLPSKILKKIKKLKKKVKSKVKGGKFGADTQPTSEPTSEPSSSVNTADLEKSIADKILDTANEGGTINLSKEELEEAKGSSTISKALMAIATSIGAKIIYEGVTYVGKEIATFLLYHGLSLAIGMFGVGEKKATKKKKPLDKATLVKWATKLKAMTGGSDICACSPAGANQNANDVGDLPLFPDAPMQTEESAVVDVQDTDGEAQPTPMQTGSGLGGRMFGGSIRGVSVPTIPKSDFMSVLKYARKI